ncbi:MAG: hypothetical protein AB1609_22970 [Bacillota bacterium]
MNREARVVARSRVQPEITVARSKARVPPCAKALEAELVEGEQLYNGRIYRLLRWAADGGRLHLELGVTRYFRYLAVRAALQAQPWPVLVPGGQPDLFWSHYLAIDVLARTADGLLVLTQRSGRVAVAGGAWILSAGETAEAGTCAPEALDMVGHALRRELGVVRLPRVLGWCLAVDERDGAWSLGALVELAETWPAIRAARCAEAWERARLEALPPEKLAVALRDRPWAPLARAVGLWAKNLLAARP